jgi:hypothetical protein
MTTSIPNINELNQQEILDLVIDKMYGNIFFIEKDKQFNETDIGTIIVPDYGEIKGYTITNNQNLPDYQNKINQLDDWMHGSEYDSYDINEKCFIVYLIFFMFLFPDTPIVWYIRLIINIYNKNQIKYYQILFKEIVIKLGLAQNKIVKKIEKEFNIKYNKPLTGGGRKHNLIIIIICFLFSVSFSVINFNNLATKLPTTLANNYESELNHAIVSSKRIITSLNSLTKKQETVIINSLRKNVNSHIKHLTKDKKHKILNFISDTIDTLKIINVFDSNNKLFSFIIDSKKVGNNLNDILNHEFKFNIKNTVILLGNISKLALYAGSCLNKNFVLILESSTALGSFTNALSSLNLLYELNQHALKTAYSFTKVERQEIITGDLDLGISLSTNVKESKNNTKKTKHKKITHTKKKNNPLHNLVHPKSHEYNKHENIW